MAKTVFALIFTLFVSASIPSPVFAAARPVSKPVPVTVGGFSLSPIISGYLFSGSEQRDPTQTYGLKVGYDKIGTSFTNNLGIEGTMNYFTTTSKTDAGNDTCYLFRLDAIYPFILGNKWMPFLAVGGGGIVIDSVSHPDKSPLFNYGVGLKYFLEDYLAVRADARHLLVYNNVDTRNNFEVGIGVSYYFGKERKKKPKPKQEEKKDAKNGKKPDGTATKSVSAIPALEEIATTAGGEADGERKPALKGETASVPPSTSLVPLIALAPLLALESVFEPFLQVEMPQGSAGEKPVLKEGGPTRVEEVFKPVRPDKGTTAAEELKAPSQRATATAPRTDEKAKAEESETAGRVEEKAVSPVILPPPATQTETPAPAGTSPSPVKAGESIPEPAPSLPVMVAQTQPAPAQVEKPARMAVGKKVARKLAIEFNVNSLYVKPKYYNKLSKIAGMMKSSANASARIEGHADATGRMSDNIKLSKQRAQSVRNSLIKLGVTPDRISSMGYGPSQPIADNVTVEGRRRNRRAVTFVTLIIYE